MSRLAKADAWRCTSDACRIRRCDGQRWPMSIGRCLWTRRPLIGWLRFNRRADLCSGLGGGRGSRTGVLRYLPESYLSRRTPVFLFLNSSTTPHSVPPSPGFLPSQWRHKKSPRPPSSSPSVQSNIPPVALCLCSRPTVIPPTILQTRSSLKRQLVLLCPISVSSTSTSSDVLSAHFLIYSPFVSSVLIILH